MLANGGSFFLFEHNPWNPLTTHAVRNCAFDENAVLINGRDMRKRMDRGGLLQARHRLPDFLPAPVRKTAATRALPRQGSPWGPIFRACAQACHLTICGCDAETSGSPATQDFPCTRHRHSVRQVVGR